jgi:hypothetical protein
MRRGAGEVLIDHREQRNHARLVVSDTAHNDLIPVKIVAVNLDAEFLPGLQP